MVEFGWLVVVCDYGYVGVVVIGWNFDDFDYVFDGVGCGCVVVCDFVVEVWWVCDYGYYCVW